MKGNTLREVTWLLCITQLIGGRTCLEPRLSDLSWSVLVITLTHIDNTAQFSCSVVFDSATSRTAAHQDSLSITNCESLLKLMSIESVMPSNHLILFCPLLLLPSIMSSIRVFSNEANSLHEVAKVLEFQLQHQSFQWTPRTDLL